MLSILIVDDCPQVRYLLGAFLAADYECLAAASSEEALDVLIARPVDLVISDVTLPGMGGVELLGIIRERWPAVPVLIITGGSETMGPEDYLSAGAAGYIEKPFSAAAVEELVARTIAGAKGEAS